MRWALIIVVLFFLIIFYFIGEKKASDYNTSSEKFENSIIANKRKLINKVLLVLLALFFIQFLLKLYLFWSKEKIQIFIEKVIDYEKNPHILRDLEELGYKIDRNKPILNNLIDLEIKLMEQNYNFKIEGFGYSKENLQELNLMLMKFYHGIGTKITLEDFKYLNSSFKKIEKLNI